MDLENKHYNGNAMTCRICKKNIKGKKFYFLCRGCFKAEKHRIHYQNKRKNKPSPLYLETWFDSLFIHSFCCRVCKKNPGKERDIFLDHIIPLSFGGENKCENIQPLCKKCNKVKSKIEAYLRASSHNKIVEGMVLFERNKELFSNIDFAA